jgi:hypothetical protein
MRYSMNCPEVNGALAAIQEMEEEGTLTAKKAEKVAKQWLEAHGDCPFCAREAAEHPLPENDLAPQEEQRKHTRPASRLPVRRSTGSAKRRA